MQLEGVSLILSSDEFSVIIAAAGMDGIFGIFDDASNVDQHKVYRILHALVQKGFFINDGNVFMPEKGLGDIINIIKNHQSVIMIYPPDDSLPVKCCYLTESNICVTEPVVSSSELYKIYSIEPSEIMEILDSEGYFSEKISNSQKEIRLEMLEEEDIINALLEDTFIGLTIDKYINKLRVVRAVIDKNIIYALKNNLYETEKFSVDNMMKILEITEQGVNL